MKKKLNTILLVDDLEADIFLISRVIEKAKITKNIKTCFGAQDALDYLTNNINDSYSKPEIIFLDINMPDMSGWDFLEAYNMLNEDIKAKVVVCMLTTSRSETDRNKAAQYNVVNEFTNKPLTNEFLMDIVKKNFPNHF